MAYNNVRRDPESFNIPTMKPPSVQTDIQKAVKDYVDSLISERSGAGRGMAVSSNELMVAARAASIKVNHQDFNRSYLKPAVHLISDCLPPETARAAAPSNGRISRKPPVPKVSKPKREPHWLTWRTGNTPAPSDVTEPRAPSARPGTVASRLATPAPRIDSPDVEILTLADPNIRSASRINTPAPPRGVTPVSHRVKTPAEHKFNTFGLNRGHTPGLNNIQTLGPNRTNTPASMKADYRDPFADRQVAPAELVLKPKTPQNPAYMPALKAWVTNANDYERDVAYSLMQVLSTGGAPMARSRPRPKTAVPGLNKMVAGPKRHIPKTAGVRTSVPAHWQQIYSDPRHEQYIVNNMAKALKRKEPDMYLGPAQESEPVTRQMYNIKPPLPVDTSHLASCFMDSHKPYRGSFVINPEWVSELQPATKPHPAQMAESGPKAMRYGSD